MYIPEKVTDRQLAWVIMNQYELLKYMKVSAFSLKKPKQEDNLDWKHLHGMSEIMKELKEKNLINIQEKKGNKLM